MEDKLATFLLLIIRPLRKINLFIKNVNIAVKEIIKPFQSIEVEVCPNCNEIKLTNSNIFGYRGPPLKVVLSLPSKLQF